jgi:post-segregation antitoxin (ccd killing protein)
MTATATSIRKRPVNLTLNGNLVAQAKTYTSNLSATIDSLLAEFVSQQQQAQLGRQQLANACADDWNAVHASVGSFADGHSTL